MFKDVMNRWLTTGLFKETAKSPDTVIMTVDEGRKRFVELKDMTGYKFASKYLGGYPHWKALESSSFSSVLDEWKEELEVALRCEALCNIGVQADEGHFQANKFLADRGWQTRSAGRPSKEEVDKRINQDAKVTQEARRFLTPITPITK